MSRLKFCRQCDNEKPLTEFPKDKSKKDGHYSLCKECKCAQSRNFARHNQEVIKERGRRYYEANKEQIAVRAKYYREKNRQAIAIRKNRYYQANRKAILEREARWSKANAEYIRAYKKRYQEENKETRKAYQALWKAKNPDKVRAAYKKRIAKNPERARILHKVRSARRHARLYLAPGNFTAEEFTQLCEAYGNKCLCCNRADVPLGPDHVVPIARDGTNDIGNIQPLCLPCNMRKHIKIIDYRPHCRKADNG